MRTEVDGAMLRVAAYDVGKRHFESHGPRPEGPLSGIWAGESIPELSDLYGLDLFDDELADAFEDGFWDGLELELGKESDEHRDICPR